MRRESVCGAMRMARHSSMRSEASAGVSVLHGVEKSEVRMQTFVAQCCVDVVHEECVAEAEHGVEGGTRRAAAAFCKGEFGGDELSEGAEVDFGDGALVAHELFVRVTGHDVFAECLDVCNCRTHLRQGGIAVVAPQECALVVRLCGDDLTCPGEGEGGSSEEDLPLLPKDVDMAGGLKPSEEVAGAREPCDGDAEAQEFDDCLG